MNPPSRTTCTVNVLDLVRGGENMELKIAAAEYLSNQLSAVQSRWLAVRGRLLAAGQ